MKNMFKHTRQDVSPMRKNLARPPGNAPNYNTSTRYSRYFVPDTSWAAGSQHKVPNNHWIIGPLTPFPTEPPLLGLTKEL